MACAECGGQTGLVKQKDAMGRSLFTIRCLSCGWIDKAELWRLGCRGAWIDQHTVDHMVAGKPIDWPIRDAKQATLWGEK